MNEAELLITPDLGRAQTAPFFPDPCSATLGFYDFFNQVPGSSPSSPDLSGLALSDAYFCACQEKNRQEMEPLCRILAATLIPACQAAPPVANPSGRETFDLELSSLDQGLRRVAEADWQPPLYVGDLQTLLQKIAYLYDKNENDASPHDYDLLAELRLIRAEFCQRLTARKRTCEKTAHILDLLCETLTQLKEKIRLPTPLIPLAVLQLSYTLLTQAQRFFIAADLATAGEIAGTIPLILQHFPNLPSANVAVAITLLRQSGLPEVQLRPLERAFQNNDLEVCDYLIAHLSPISVPDLDTLSPTLQRDFLEYLKHLRRVLLFSLSTT